MTNQEYPAEFLELIKTITNKRAKIVIEYIKIILYKLSIFYELYINKQRIINLL